MTATSPKLRYAALCVVTLAGLAALWPAAAALPRNDSLARTATIPADPAASRVGAATAIPSLMAQARGLSGLCSGAVQLLGESGTFGDGSAEGQRYVANMDCSWTITAPPGRFISLRFLRFDLQSNIACSADYVELYAGANTSAPVISRFCGSDLPPPVLSTTNVITVRFVSDSSWNYYGFAARFSANVVVTTPTCAALSELGVPSIVHVGPYTHNLDCRWRISGAVRRVQVELSRMELQSSVRCAADAVEVYDGGNTNARLVLLACGSTTHSVLTSGSTALIRFRTDSSVAGLGFTAMVRDWDAGDSSGGGGEGGLCSGTVVIRDPTTIASNPPNTNYANNMNCEWRIQPPQHSRVVLTFLRFSLEQSTNCRFDSVVVHGGGSELLRACGSSMPSPVVVNGAVTVRFETDGSVVRTGFAASVQFEGACMGTADLYGASGQLSSETSGTLPRSRVCEWIVHAPLGHRVRFTFPSFTLPGNCVRAALDVFSGGTEQGTRTRLCGGTPSPLVVASDTVLVRLTVGASDVTGDLRMDYSTSWQSCSGSLQAQAPRGVVASSGPGVLLTSGTSCTWMVDVPSAPSILLRFTRASLNALACIDILAGDETLQYCGTTVPSTWRLSASSVRVTFSSPAVTEGFAMEFYASAPDTQALPLEPLYWPPVLLEGYTYYLAWGVPDDDPDALTSVTAFRRGSASTFTAFSGPTAAGLMSLTARPDFAPAVSLTLTGPASVSSRSVTVTEFAFTLQPTNAPAEAFMVLTRQSSALELMWFPPGVSQRGFHLRMLPIDAPPVSAWFSVSGEPSVGGNITTSPVPFSPNALSWIADWPASQSEVLVGRPLSLFAQAAALTVRTEAQRVVLSEGTVHLAVVPNGNVTLSDGPGAYQRNAECLWMLRAPPGHYLRLRVTSLQLGGAQLGDDCLTSTRSMLAFARKSSAFIQYVRVICQGDGTHPYEAASGTAWVHFVARDGSGAGFEVQATAHPHASSSSTALAIILAVGIPALCVGCALAAYCVLVARRRRASRQPQVAVLPPPGAAQQAHWRCALCSHDNPVAADLCEICGTHAALLTGSVPRMAPPVVQGMAPPAFMPPGAVEGDPMATMAAASAARQQSFRARRMQAQQHQHPAGGHADAMWSRRFDSSRQLRWLRREPAAGGGAAAAGAAPLTAQPEPVLMREIMADGSLQWVNRSRAKGIAATFDVPQIASLPFERKVEWFHGEMDRLRVPWEQGHQRIEVRRDYLLGDSVQAIMRLTPAQMRQTFRFSFAGEPGLDAGGVAREWFLLVTQELFNLDRGLFQYSHVDNITYQINPASGLANDQHLRFFQFTGRVMAKALLDRQVVPTHLALPLYKHILALPLTLADVEFVDKDLYRSLRWMMENDGVEALMLDFTTEVKHFDTNVTVELKPGGAHIDVTDVNKREYIELRMRHRLMDSVREQLAHLLRGFYEVVPVSHVAVFDFQELEMLLCGLIEIDVDDWQRNTLYRGEYSNTHKVIKWFWSIVRGMTNDQRARLLQFVTGTSRVPVQGFEALQGNDGRVRKFTIMHITKADSVYPRAHTCFNRVDLPAYSSRQELENCLTLVINMEVTGFSMD